MSLRARAHQTAEANGASKVAIAQMCAPDTLLLCLAEAGIEPEIIADVAEAVELSAVDALTLAANVVPTDTLAELAFLTATEAKGLIGKCAERAQQLGITFDKMQPVVGYHPTDLIGAGRPSVQDYEEPQEQVSSFESDSSGASLPKGGPALPEAYPDASIYASAYAPSPHEPGYPEVRSMLTPDVELSPIDELRSYAQSMNEDTNPLTVSTFSSAPLSGPLGPLGPQHSQGSSAPLASGAFPGAYDASAPLSADGNSGAAEEFTYMDGVVHSAHPNGDSGPLQPPPFAHSPLEEPGASAPLAPLDQPGPPESAPRSTPDPPLASLPSFGFADPAADPEVPTPLGLDRPSFDAGAQSPQSAYLLAVPDDDIEAPGGLSDGSAPGAGLPAEHAPRDSSTGGVASANGSVTSMTGGMICTPASVDGGVASVHSGGGASVNGGVASAKGSVVSANGCVTNANSGAISANGGVVSVSGGVASANGGVASYTDRSVAQEPDAVAAFVAVAAPPTLAPIAAPAPTQQHPESHIPRSPVAGAGSSPPAAASPTTPRSRLRSPSASPRLRDASTGIEQSDSGMFLKTPGSLPSFMRPTTATEARARREATPPPSPRPPRRSPMALISPTSNLVRATASTAAKFASHEGPSNAPRHTPGRPDTHRSTPPQSARMTIAKPFRLRTSVRPSMHAGLTTEELRQKASLDERTREMEGWNQKLRRATVAPAAKPAAPAKGPTSFKPFNLSSLSRHEQQQEELRVRIRQEEQAAQKARVFKAQPFDAQGLSAAAVTRGPAVVHKPTVAKGPSFMKADNTYKEKMTRAQYRNSHAAHTARVEQERRQRLDKPIAEAAAIRQKYQFKATRMPDFTRPFAPDPSKVAPTTVPKLPTFATAIRLGATQFSPAKKKSSKVAPTSPRLATPHGAQSDFAASLRH